MKVSVCITTKTDLLEMIALFEALENQTLKPDEVILITANQISNQFPNLNFQLLRKQGVSRAEGRNLAIKKAKNEIIAITDAGCIPHKDWLKNITKSFSPTSSRLRGTTPDVVAGGYRMVAKNNFQRACSIFLGVKPKNIDKQSLLLRSNEFMPSARSMALTKTAWKKAGGFPENLIDTAEDTVFNIKLFESGAKFAVASEAIVDWLMPDSVFEFAKKVYKYAKGDAVSGIWWHPVKKWKTHNIKVLTIFARYLLAIGLMVAWFNGYLEFGYLYLFVFIGIYLLFSYKKAKWWGIILQFVSDFACIIGFSHGILQTGIKRHKLDGRT